MTKANEKRAREFLFSRLGPHATNMDKSLAAELGAAERRSWERGRDKAAEEAHWQITQGVDAETTMAACKTLVYQEADDE